MPTSEGRLIIAVDFDGTLSLEGGEYPAPGEPNIPLIRKLQQMRRGFNPVIIIWTCRTGSDLQPMKDFLNSNEIPWDRINENYEDQLNFAEPKIFADVYIDDRAKTPEDFIETGLDGVRIKDDTGKDMVLVESTEVVEVLIALVQPEYVAKVAKEHFNFPGRKVRLEIKSSGKIYAKVPVTKNASVGFCVARTDPFLVEEFKQILDRPERFVFKPSGNMMDVYLTKY